MATCPTGTIAEATQCVSILPEPESSDNWAVQKEVVEAILGLTLIALGAVTITALVLKCMNPSKMSFLATLGVFFAWIETYLMVWALFHFWFIYQESSISQSVPIILSIVFVGIAALNTFASVTICIKSKKGPITLILFSAINFRLLRYKIAKSLNKSVFAIMVKTHMKTPPFARISLIFYLSSILSLAVSVSTIVTMLVAFASSNDLGD